MFAEATARSRMRRMAKKARRVGRPAKDKSERRDKPLSVVFSEWEQTLVKRAAEAAEAKVSDFIRSAAVKEARQVLGE